MQYRTETPYGLDHGLFNTAVYMVQAVQVKLQTALLTKHSSHLFPK